MELISVEEAGKLFLERVNIDEKIKYFNESIKNELGTLEMELTSLEFRIFEKLLKNGGWNYNVTSTTTSKYILRVYIYNSIMDKINEE